MGMKFPHWPDIVKYASHRDDVIRMFAEIIQEREQMGAACDLIMVVMPNKCSDIYSKVHLHLGMQSFLI